jgi:hypothetical protein
VNAYVAAHTHEKHIAPRNELLRTFETSVAEGTLPEREEAADAKEAAKEARHEADIAALRTEVRVLRKERARARLGLSP